MKRSNNRWKNKKIEKTEDKPSDLSTDQLITLYQHMTHDIRVRDNLFIPLSYAAVPTVVIAWSSINSIGIAFIGVASILFYMVNLLFIFRFTAYQDETIRMLNKQSNFKEIVAVQDTHYFGEKLFEKRVLIRVRTLRLYSFYLLILVWVLMFFIKHFYPLALTPPNTSEQQKVKIIIEHQSCDTIIEVPSVKKDTTHTKLPWIISDSLKIFILNDRHS